MSASEGSNLRIKAQSWDMTIVLIVEMTQNKGLSDILSGFQGVASSENVHTLWKRAAAYKLRVIISGASLGNCIGRQALT